MRAMADDGDSCLILTLVEGDFDFATRGVDFVAGDSFRRFAGLTLSRGGALSAAMRVAS